MTHSPAGKKKYTALAALLMALVAVALPRPVYAGMDDRQYKIEAAFLYNFFNYITWPGYASPQAMQQSVICLYENDPVEPYLEYIQRKKAGERQILIHTLTAEEYPPQDCQMVFMRNPSAAQTQALASHHILVVSESTNAADDSAMIELVRDDERIRMQINKPLMDKNDFQISSRLLNIAEVVK